MYHIMIRGIERRKILLNNKDSEDFLERLSRLLPEMKTSCYAWVFIPNHVHFLFRTGLVLLATLMRRPLIGYAEKNVRRSCRTCIKYKILIARIDNIKIDGFVKSPTSALRCILRHCSAL